MELRYYQSAAIEAVKYHLDNTNENPIVQMPTGSGKSVVIPPILQHILTKNPKAKILMLTHVAKLVEQNFDKLIKMWNTAPVGIYSASLKKKNSNARIIFATVASIVNKLDILGGITHIIVDECHLCSDNDMTMYKKIANHFKCRMIGLTATAWRSQGGKLENGTVFTKVVYDLCSIENYNRLVDEGFLSPLIPVYTSQENYINVDNIKISKGEFNASDIDEQLQNTGKMSKILREVVQSVKDRKHGLVFLPSIKSCEIAQEILKELGEKSHIIHSKLTDLEKRDNLKDFEEKRVKYLLNVDMLTTGYDCPSVDFIVVMRPTQSSSLWVQILGRGTRMHPEKKDCLIFDYARNTQRLGTINDPKISNAVETRECGECGFVNGKSAKKCGGCGASMKREDVLPPMKTCEKCGFMAFASTRQCGFCGHTFPVRDLTTNEASTLDVVTKTQKIENVKEVRYEIHHKQKPEGISKSVKMTFFCFSGHSYLKWLKIDGCPEWQKKQFHNFWNKAGKTTSPLTCEQFIDFSNKGLVKFPKTIIAKRNNKQSFDIDIIDWYS